MMMRELLPGGLLLYEHVPPVGRVLPGVGREGPRRGRGAAGGGAGGSREPRFVLRRRRPHLLLLSPQHLLLLLLKHLGLLLARYSGRCYAY